MHAIKTKYVCPKGSKGARMTAVCDTKRITIAYDSALDAYDNHRAAALALAAHLVSVEDYSLYTGSLADCHVHVLSCKL